ncbi:hypothetical protein JXJ21_10440 [candidate division KSB1 bacterium]|nr:hypothetical protein [candidate division KSB1 bacterium]
MKPVWKGNIALGSIEIAVNLVSAVSTRNLALTLLHQPCASKIKHKRVCPLHGDVPANEIIKAYFYEQDKYIPLDGHDFASIELGTQKSICLSKFVDIEAIEPIYFNKTYYCIPDGHIAAEKYALLRNALKRKRKIGIAQITYNRKESIVALWQRKRAIALSTLHYENEILPLSGFEVLQTSAPRSRTQFDEIDKLIEIAIDRFNPRQFRDQFFIQLMELIRQKIDSSKHEKFSQAKAESMDSIKSVGSKKQRTVVNARKSMAKVAEPELADTGSV